MREYLKDHSKLVDELRGKILKAKGIGEADATKAEANPAEEKTTDKNAKPAKKLQ